MQKFLVVRPGVAGQFEDLQQMILHVSLGMMLRRLLHVFQGHEQHAKDGVGVFRLLTLAGRFGIEIEIGVLAVEHFFQLGNRRPFDRLAGDGAFEDVVGLVLVIDG